MDKNSNSNSNLHLIDRIWFNFRNAKDTTIHPVVADEIPKTNDEATKRKNQNVALLAAIKKPKRGSLMVEVKKPTNVKKAVQSLVTAPSKNQQKIAFPQLQNIKPKNKILAVPMIQDEDGDDPFNSSFLDLSQAVQPLVAGLSKNQPKIDFPEQRNIRSGPVKKFKFKPNNEILVLSRTQDEDPFNSSFIDIDQIEEDADSITYEGTDIIYNIFVPNGLCIKDHPHFFSKVSNKKSEEINEVNGVPKIVRKNEVRKTNVVHENEIPKTLEKVEEVVEIPENEIPKTNDEPTKRKNQNVVLVAEIKKPKHDVIMPEKIQPTEMQVMFQLGEIVQRQQELLKIKFEIQKGQNANANCNGN